MQSSDSSKQTRVSVIDYELLGEKNDHRKKDSVSTSANTLKTIHTSYRVKVNALFGSSLTSLDTTVTFENEHKYWADSSIKTLFSCATVNV